MLILGLVNGGDFSVFLSNYLQILYSLLYVLYFGFLYTSKREMLGNLFKKCGIFFNVMMVLNLLIVMYQIKNPGSIIGVNEYGMTISNYDPDLMSGLFLYCGTPELCLYATFIVLYDLNYYYYSKKKKYLLLGLVLLFLNMILSLFNDNKAYILFAPVFFLIWLYCISGNSKRKVKKRLMLFILGLLTVGVAVLFTNIRDYINNHFVAYIGYILNTLNGSIVADGSNERFSMIISAFARNNTYLLGEGIGKYAVTQSNLFGYRHFGQGSIGTLLYICGLWTVLLILRFYYNIFFRNLKTDDRFAVALILFMVIFEMIYNQCLYVPILAFEICLIIYMLVTLYNKEMI